MAYELLDRELDLNQLWTPAQAGELVVATEVDWGHLTPPEVAALERRTYFERGSAPVWSFCGDERELLLGSISLLKEERPDALSPEVGGVADFAQNAGGAFAHILAGTAHNGPDFIEKVGGLKVMIDRRARLANEDAKQNPRLGVIPAQHTGEASEAAAFLASGLNPKAANEAAAEGRFCAHGPSPHACAACNGFGAIIAAGANAKEIRFDDGVTLFEVISSDIGKVGVTNTMIAESFVESSQSLAKYIPADTQYGRQGYVDSRLPVMSLKGEHLLPEKTQHMVGLDPEMASIPGESYRSDAGASTVADVRALWELGIPPEIILPFKIGIATIIRSVLAGRDPRKIRMGVSYGKTRDYDEALDKIKRLARVR